MIDRIFNRDFKDVIDYPKVKQKILLLKDEIERNTQDYDKRRSEKMKQLNQKYLDLTNNNDLESN